MKTLANCSPTEFLMQTNKIRKSVERWLTATDVVNIRKRLPYIDPNATEEEKKKAFKDQADKNFAEMLDSCLEAHPKETIELMALVCFIEPSDADNHQMTEYLGAILEIIQDENCMAFFRLLVQLAQTSGLKAPVK